MKRTPTTNQKINGEPMSFVRLGSAGRSAASSTRQGERQRLRDDALAVIGRNVGGSRRLRRLMARSKGNRDFRYARGLPEPQNVARRGGLRK